MPFNWGGAGGGAAAGAQVGSSFGPWGTGLGAIAGGIFGGLGKKKGQSMPDPYDFALFNRGTEQDIIGRLMSFNDTPNQPLGQSARGVLMNRMSEDFIPQFFRNDVLNPFLNAQFRLGREQVGRDLTTAQEQFQRMGAYFTPDLPKFMQNINERQNLNEQDFLGNLGFRGAEVAEQLRTDAIARSLGLEQVTAGVMDQLLGRQAQRFGFASDIGAIDFSQPEAGMDPFGFLAGGGFDPFIDSIGGMFNRTGASGQGDSQGFQDLDNWLFQTIKQSFLPMGGP